MISAMMPRMTTPLSFFVRAARRALRPRTTFVVCGALAAGTACASGGAGGSAGGGAPPTTGITYDCADGTAFTVVPVGQDVTLRLDGTDVRLLKATPVAAGTRWADATFALQVAGDSATVERQGAVVKSGCGRRR